MNNLSTEQYAFFAQIADLAFVNPFSREREQAEWEILEINPQAKPVTDRRELLAAKLDWHFQELTQQGSFDIRIYEGKTQDMMCLSWLVKAFYSYQHRFDDFIKAQKQASDKSLELPFAQNILDKFEYVGFTQKKAIHFIALLFQLQRAYRFIDEAVSGNSDAIIDLRKRLWNNIFTFNPEWYLNYLCNRMEDFSLLLLGETGTGKSLVAKAIGCSGYIPFDAVSCRFVESFSASFRAINLSQYSTGVLESRVVWPQKRGIYRRDRHPSRIIFKM